MRFWIGVLDQPDQQGWSNVDAQQLLAGQFIDSNEFAFLFGENPTNDESIDAMNLNVLSRLPDQGGYDVRVGGMQAGLTRKDILVAFTESDQNVNNKVDNIEDGIWVV